MRLIALLSLILLTASLVWFFPTSIHFNSSNTEVESVNLSQVYLSFRGKSGSPCLFSDKFIHQSRADDPNRNSSFICHYNSQGLIHVQTLEKDALYYIPVTYIDEEESLETGNIVEVYINNILAGFYMRFELPYKKVHNDILLYLDGKVTLIDKEGIPIQFSEIFPSSVLKDYAKTNQEDFLLFSLKKDQSIHKVTLAPYVARALREFQYEDRPKSIITLHPPRKEMRKGSDSIFLQNLKEKHLALWKKYVSNAR